MSEKVILNAIRTLLFGMVIGVPLIIYKQVMNPFIIPKTTLFQAIAELAVFLWAALAVAYPAYRPRRTPLTIGVFVFLGAMTITSFFGGNVMRSLWSTEERALGLVALWHFGFLYLALASLGDKIPWRAIFKTSVAVASAISVAALFFYIPALNDLFANAGGVRPGATFGNPTFLAGYLLFHLFLGLWLIRVEKKMAWKIYSAAGAVVALAGIFRTQTRGDMIAALLGLLVAAGILAVRRLRPFSFVGSILKNIWLIIVLLVLVGGGFLYATRASEFWRTVPGAQRLLSISPTGGDLELRSYAWRSALAAWKDRPLTGYGFENFNLAFERHYDPRLLTTGFDETYWDKPHNVPLEYLVTGGIVGLLAYLWLWGAALYELSRIRKRDPAIGPIFFAMLFAYFVRNLVVFDTIGTYLLFFLVLAFIDTIYRETRGPSSARPVTPKRADIHLSYLAGGALIVAALPVYFLNSRIVDATQKEYWGSNYDLNRLPAEAVASYEAALKVPEPYRDSIRLTYAGRVKQSFDNGVVYPDMQNLHKRLLDQIRTVIQDDPQNYFNYIFLAETENSFAGFDPQKYLTEAQALSEKALALSPRRQQVYYILARTKILKGDYRGAYNDFETAVALNPESGDAHFYFALLAYQTGNVAKGDEELARATSLGRTVSSMSEAVALGTIQGDLKHDYDAAVNYYNIALSYHPIEAQANEIKLKRALAYFLGGRSSSAQDAFVELGKSLDYKTLAIFPDLKPILDGLKVPY